MTTEIKVISFDFWNTLAIPNKVYSENRDGYLKATYGVTREDYLATKAFLEKGSLDHNKAWSTAECFQMLLKNQIDSGYAAGIANEVGKMFLNNPPEIMSNELTEAFMIIRNKGIKMVITSNTNFISGHFIIDLMFRKGMLGWFEHTNFSDILGICKPDVRMFHRVASQMEVPLDNIIHIGDSQAYDVDGAEAAGMRGRKVGSFIPHREILEYARSL